MLLRSSVCHQQLALPPIYRGLKLPSGLETWLKGPGAQMGFKTPLKKLNLSTLGKRGDLASVQASLAKQLLSHSNPF